MSSVQFSCSVVFDSLQSRESQHARPPCPSPTPGVHSDSCPISDAIQPSHPLSSASPAPNPSHHQSLFQWVNSSHANIRWIMEKASEFQENIYFCLIDYAKAFYCVDHHKLWKILQEMGIPDHLTCLLRNLYAGQEATVRNGHGTTDWFQIEKECLKAVYYHPAYLTYVQSTSWETLD